MHLIVGLGNPGKKYNNTRHNAGFLALEYLRTAWDFPEFRARASFFAEYSEGRIGNTTVILARPETFMNLSGKSVCAVTNFFKIPPENIAIIHDDLDITLGEVRMSFDSRSAGHRGVESIINALGTKAFIRFRIGIGHRDDPDTKNIPKDTERFVLDAFSSGEQSAIESALPTLAHNLDHWIRSHTL